MGLIIKTDEKGIKVFRKDKVSKAGNNYSTYCIKASSKDASGEWQSAFINIGFKKGVSVDNKAVINIKNAFPVVDTYNGKSSVRYMITDFDVISAGEKPNDNADAFMDVGSEEELPFS